MEAHAAQAVVVQYPFKILSLCRLFFSCVSTFQKHNFNSVSHTDLSVVLCGFECKKSIIDSNKSQFY